MKSFLKLVFILLFSASPLFGKNKIDGLWHASFTVMGQAMLLDLTVKPGAKEAYISNPEMEMAQQIPCADVLFKKNNFSFKIPFIGLSFKGTYFPKGDSIVGSMDQNGITWDVHFYRTVQQKNKVHQLPLKVQLLKKVIIMDIQFEEIVGGVEEIVWLQFQQIQMQKFPLKQHLN